MVQKALKTFNGFKSMQVPSINKTIPSHHKNTFFPDFTKIKLIKRNKYWELFIFFFFFIITKLNKIICCCDSKKQELFSALLKMKNFFLYFFAEEINFSWGKQLLKLNVMKIHFIVCFHKKQQKRRRKNAFNNLIIY